MTTTPTTGAEMPEALRLADWLQSRAESVEHINAAAELRRLHALSAAAPAANLGALPGGHPALAPDMLVNGGALTLAVNVLRRAGKDEVADELLATAVRADQGAAAPAAPSERPAMPETWHVVAHIKGQPVLSIGYDWVSGRDLASEEEHAIVGMAQHLLSFVGYGLPPSDFNPDDAAPQAQQPGAAEGAPIDMVLHCPACGLQHIDAPEPELGPSVDGSGDMPIWSNPPHRSHLCHGCGHIWRPADVPTNGVAAVKTTGKSDSPIAARAGVQAVPSDAEIDALLDTPGNINWVLADARQRWRLFARTVLARWGAHAAVSAPEGHELGEDGWPKLAQPAKTAGGMFGKGVSARLLVEACYRRAQYEAERAAQTSDERREEERNRRALWDMANGPISDATPAAAVSAPSVPEGWKLVPVEPTSEMRAAADRHVWPLPSAAAVRAAIAAAPAAPMSVQPSDFEQAVHVLGTSLAREHAVYLTRNGARKLLSSVLAAAPQAPAGGAQ